MLSHSYASVHVRELLVSAVPGPLRLKARDLGLFCAVRTIYLLGPKCGFGSYRDWEFRQLLLEHTELSPNTT